MVSLILFDGWMLALIASWANEADTIEYMEKNPQKVRRH